MSAAPPMQVFYDGQCRFCARQMRRLLRLAPKGRIVAVDFQAPGALDSVRGLTHAMCMKEMWLVSPDGARYGGARAVVHAAGTRRILWAFLWLYYVPPLRQLADWTYGRIAARRYELAGRELESEGCDGGTCTLHVPPPDAGVDG